MEKVKNCTGAIDQEKELNGEVLAYYRLQKFDGLDYFAVQMDSDQLSERRIFMRKVLSAYPKWNNLNNEQLENIRLYSIGNGYIVEDENGHEYFLISNRVAEQDGKFRKERAMMPFEFMGLMGKDFDWKKYRTDISASKDMINQYIVHYAKFKENGMGLYIHSGTKGSGKTMLACCMIGEITKRYNGSVKFINILDFLEMTKKSYDGDNEVNAIYQASLLVLDDIGVQMSREWVDTVLYRLINERYNNRLPTIYTSNIPVEHLKMDDRIIDRIESTTYAVKLPEEPIRRDTRHKEKGRLFDEITKSPT